MTSNLKTRGMTPSEFSQTVEAEFINGETAKRHKDLAVATRKVVLTNGDLARATGRPLSSTQLGFANSPAAKTHRPLSKKIFAQSQSLAQTYHDDVSGVELPPTMKVRKAKPFDPFRPQLIPVPKPKLRKPYRAQPNELQKQNYTYSSYARIPNPALPPQDEAEAARFPHNTRPTHHAYQLNEQVRTAYYSTHWDDRFRTNNPYQPYEVEVLPNSSSEPEAANASGSAAAGEAKQASPSPHPLSPRFTARAAASLGYGSRHENWRDYLHHTQPVTYRTQQSSTSSIGSPASPSATSSATGRILMPVAGHLLDGPSTTSTAVLSVPYSLARFVPLDSRDGTGQRGHLNASGLGYGKSHRNHYRYVHANPEGNSELAYFRSNHC
jgi:hypothetical protein